MGRYFIEVAYKGTHYSGFQIQQNANSIQAEVEKALQTIHRKPFHLTGSSRTDAGVHALQNFFHFDFEETLHPQSLYKLNALLPGDIAVNNIFEMPASAHSRFDATSREYIYRIHQHKNPFVSTTSLYYPYKLEFELLEDGARLIKEQLNFFSFAKTNSQVNNFSCGIIKSEWHKRDNELYYQIEANRFLRGMVRLITGTLLQIGRKKISVQDTRNTMEANSKTGFSLPPVGLALQQVKYPQNYFPLTTLRFTDF